MHRECTTIDKNGLKAVLNHENITYTCDECITYSMRAINNKVNGLYAVIDRLEKKIDALTSSGGGVKIAGGNVDKNSTFAEVVKKKR